MDHEMKDKLVVLRMNKNFMIHVRMHTALNVINFEPVVND